MAEFWVYPFLRVMPNSGRIAFFTVAACVVAFFYFLGKWKTMFIWGGRLRSLIKIILHNYCLLCQFLLDKRNDSYRDTLKWHVTRELWFMSLECVYSHGFLQNTCCLIAGEKQEKTTANTNPKNGVKKKVKKAE